MRRMMFVGENGSGKSALIAALSGREYVAHRAMSVEFHGPFINTPGEFLENRRFYPALITAAMDCHVLVMLQHADRRTSAYPPQFAAMFNRSLVGVVTHTDAPTADPELARRFLRNAGLKRMFAVNPATGEGLDELRAMLG